MYSGIGILTPQLNEVMFKNLFLSVKRGGRLILDMLNPDWVLKSFIACRHKTIIIEGQKYNIIHRREILYQPLREVNYITLTFPYHKEDSYTIQLYSLEEMSNLLEKYHYKILFCYGNFSYAVLSPNRPRMIIVADKTRNV